MQKINGFAALNKLPFGGGFKFAPDYLKYHLEKLFTFSRTPRALTGYICSSPLLPTIDTRRQGSTYAVFLFVKKPCFIAFLTGVFLFLLDILTFGCASILHYSLSGFELNAISYFWFSYFLFGWCQS
jgi:hypothetical protein